MRIAHVTSITRLSLSNPRPWMQRDEVGSKNKRERERAGDNERERRGTERIENTHAHKAKEREAEIYQ